MVDRKELEPRELTFSQAQGYEEIPGTLALEKVDYEARLKLWNLLYISAWADTMAKFGYWSTNSQWVPILETLHTDFFRRPIDDLDISPSEYKGAILDVLPFYKLFDLLQIIMRHQNCPGKFIADVVKLFDECRLAYVVDTNGPATILPAVTEREGHAIVGALHELHEAGLTGAGTHLRNAGELLNQGDWPGSIRESIHAVESVARQLDPNASQTLGPALTSLEKDGHLHPALKEGFSKLYGYTSDEQGIRHPLIDNATSPAGRDEAVFMLGACASFASYLWRRHQEGSQA